MVPPPDFLLFSKYISTISCSISSPKAVVTTTAEFLEVAFSASNFSHDSEIKDHTPVPQAKVKKNPKLLIFKAFIPLFVQRILKVREKNRVRIPNKLSISLVGVVISTCEEKTLQFITRQGQQK